MDLTDSNIFGLYYVIFSSKAILIYKIIFKNENIIIIFSCSLDLVLKIFENIFSTSLKVRHSNYWNLQQQKIDENKKASR